MLWCAVWTTWWTEPSIPCPSRRREAKNKRRMGLGVTGMANAIETVGHAYGSPEYIEIQTSILNLIKEECYKTSVEIAEVKGSFPLFDAEKYLEGEFIKTLPEEIRDGIARHGIRNSHLTSIAPTGTISTCADNVSSSIEPVFEKITKRPVLMGSGQVIVDVEDYAWGRWKT